MGLLDDVLASDAQFIVDTDGFGESIVYTPRGGSARTVNAIVVRRIPGQLDEAPSESLAEDIEVHIRNHDTEGVTRVNLGGDMVTLARRIGETPVELQVYQIIDHDTGMWHLRCR